MTLREKLDLFELPEEEVKKAESGKFLAALEYVTAEEIKTVLAFLRSKGLSIEKAKELKVATNDLSKLKTNVNFVEDVHEMALFNEDANRLSGNGLDIFKRINYCKKNNIEYKNADGQYEKFLFDESLFQKVVTRGNVSPSVESMNFVPEDDLITLEPVGIDNYDDDKTVEVSPMVVDEFRSASQDLENIEAKTTDFATVRRELENQLAELDSYRNSNNDFADEISFNDIEPESYGMGRGRAA